MKRDHDIKSDLPSWVIWEVDEELVAELEEFVCFLYRFPRVKEVNTVRALMLKKMLVRVKPSRVGLYLK